MGDRRGDCVDHGLQPRRALRCAVEQFVLGARPIVAGVFIAASIDQEQLPRVIGNLVLGREEVGDRPRCRTRFRSTR